MRRRDFIQHAGMTLGVAGAAVAAAFHRKRGIRVAILFPDGGVSPRQEHHLTCWSLALGIRETTTKARATILASRSFASLSNVTAAHSNRHAKRPMPTSCASVKTE